MLVIKTDVSQEMDTVHSNPLLPSLGDKTEYFYERLDFVEEQKTLKAAQRFPELLRYVGIDGLLGGEVKGEIKIQRAS